MKLIEPSDVERIGLVDLAHHEFGLADVHEPGDATGGLDLVDDPIPIANGLDRHRGAGLTSLKKLLERPALVRDALFADELAVGPSHGRQRVMLVGIERRYIPFAAPPSRPVAAECCPTHTVTSPCAEAQRFHPIKDRWFKHVGAGLTAEGLTHQVHELGYVEGKNLVFEYRSAEGQQERLVALAAEVVPAGPMS